jgi:hypothetical protein
MKLKRSTRKEDACKKNMGSLKNGVNKRVNTFDMLRKAT